MKTTVYLVFTQEFNKNSKRLKGKDDFYNFAHMFDTFDRAHSALGGYATFDGKTPHSIVEATIDYETLTDMASCAFTGNSYTAAEFDVVRVWNYGI